ncbi:hypothetical protein ABZ671_32745, partial [Micromonospora sp. NPDC006766]|uniref:hypothetical protein n=1 Tax=Micromonospora sp. NPDC006766 TaxID=3154778 RepID=UPI003401F971
TESTCSTGSSPASTDTHHDQLDKDYLHNADERMAGGGRADRRFHRMCPGSAHVMPDRRT